MEKLPAIQPFQGKQQEVAEFEEDELFGASGIGALTTGYKAEPAPGLPDGSIPLSMAENEGFWIDFGHCGETLEVRDSAML